MTPREKFRLAYRAARLLPHKWACHRAMDVYFAAAGGQENPETIDIFSKALHCGTRARCGEWKFAIESAQAATREGRSRTKCLAIWKSSIQFRKQRRDDVKRWGLGAPYFPATKFHLSSLARLPA